MQVTLEFPEDIAAVLGEGPEAISRNSLEINSLDGYRSGRLSETQIGRLLICDSFPRRADAQAWEAIGLTW